MPVSILQPEILLQQLACGRSGYTVIDARPAEEYECGHIAGAVSVAWEDWCESPPSGSAAVLHEPGYWGLLAQPDNARFAERLAEAGISYDRPIVVYADSERSKGREGRIAWMLLYLGALDVSLLDGGWSGWLKLSGPVEQELQKPGGGRFEINLDPRRRATFDQLVDLKRNDRMPLMIDTRTPAEFHGDCYDYQPRKGRLPSSILYPFGSLFQPNGSFVRKDSYLRNAIPDILAPAPRVAYCEVGVRAATFALLHEIYTGDILPVYDGSFMEWSFNRELPVDPGR